MPAGWQGGFGRHLAVGWRDSPATVRSLAAPRPWLEAAETVTALTVTDAAPGSSPGADAPARMARSPGCQAASRSAQ